VKLKCGENSVLKLKTAEINAPQVTQSCIKWTIECKMHTQHGYKMTCVYDF